MNIEIEFIPHKQHRFTTIGYWFVQDGTLYIQVSNEISWQNKIATVFHELIEAGICISKGITTEECDAFDAQFEEEYKRKKWDINTEAGLDKRCPYRKGHIWGNRLEWLVMFLLGADKKIHDKECLMLMESNFK